MRSLVNIQLLACLMVYAPSAHAIMVKFGTKGGPIEPPAPEPSPPPPSRPYRSPAPVWEERDNDAPDPNAQWRPQLFIPQPRYTHVIYKPPTQVPQNNAQRFVNAYIPIQKTVQPIKAEVPKNYFTPAQILSSQSLPGFGIRYFVPTYVDTRNDYQQDDARHNHIASNEVNEINLDSGHDERWKYEKDLARRQDKSTSERTIVPVYQWPAYVPSRHH